MSLESPVGIARHAIGDLPRLPSPVCLAWARMYPTPRPGGPRPNYALRRLFALTVLVLFGLLVMRLLGGLFGDDGDDVATSTASTAPPATVRVEQPPACEAKDEPTVYAREDDWFRTLVDVVYALPEQYRPPDLVPASEANYSAEYLIRSIVAEDL